MDNTCIGCGCTEDNACDGGFGDGCYWLKLDQETGLGVCSECDEHLDRFNEGDRTLAVEPDPAALEF